MKGRIQVYTGDGKGKTTAALGLALRAAGAGLKVFIAQFAKGREYSELKALERFSDIVTVKQYGRQGFIVDGQPGEKDIACARDGLSETKRIIQSGSCSLVILDEASIAVYFGLFSAHDLLDVIDAKPEHVELVITGRKADPLILERADLITEMCEVKHYFNNDVKARRGIEY
ncbi:cob(I)yrinic acid a,c-diamide adenosyltransferase [Candidatus Omnitrophota bacterium]